MTHRPILPVAALALAGCLVELEVGQNQPTAPGDPGDPGEPPPAAPRIVVAGAQDWPSDIVADADAIYWTQAGRGLIMKLGRGETAPVVLATGVHAWRLALDDERLYATDNAGDRVFALPKRGGPVTLLASGWDGPASVAVDATHVYFTTEYGGELVRVAKSGGPAEVLSSGHDYPHGVAVDDTWVYWTVDLDGVLLAVPNGGGTVEVLASGLDRPAGITLADGFIYWTNRAGDFANGSIARMRAPAARPGSDAAPSEGAIEVLATGQAHPNELAVDGGYAYWTNYDDGGVMRVGLAGGAVEVLDPPTMQGAVAIVVDAERVYWTHYLESAVYALPK